MKKISLIILLCFCSLKMMGQGRDNYWAFGYYSFTPFPQQGGTTIDFFGSVANISNHDREMNFEYANSSICDSAGNLLFYTNGGYIANSQDDTMLNGTGINPSWYTNNWIYDGLKIEQANIIIPKPGNDSLYYLFHETLDFTNTGIFYPDYLYLSIVNMKGDSGKGEVLSKNNILINDTLEIGSITACKHANGRDWWIIAPEYGIQAAFYLILATPDSTYNFNHQSFAVDGTQGGQACFAPDGSKLVWNNWYGEVFFDFDRCSGTLTLLDDTVFSYGWLGTSISSNSRYAYLSHGDSILQFDLQATDITASVEVVAELDSSSDSLSTAFWIHQLGPDGKIYLSTGNSTFYLHCIDQPDSGGLACNTLQHSVNLTRYNVTIPNFPNYNLGRLQGSPCDTLQWTGISSPIGEQVAIKINPNPASNSFYINYDIPTNENLLFVLYDSYGKEVMRKTLYGTFKNLLVHTDKLSDGIYFWSAQAVGGDTNSGSKRNTNSGLRRQNGKVVIIH